jgi:TPR repeat protein
MDNEKLFLKADELYEKGEFSSAFDTFLQAAENGDTSSMLRLASMYTPGKTYAIWFNSKKFNAFRDTDNNPAIPYLLVFQTKE